MEVDICHANEHFGQGSFYITNLNKARADLSLVSCLCSREPCICIPSLVLFTLLSASAFGPIFCCCLHPFCFCAPNGLHRSHTLHGSWPWVGPELHPDLGLHPATPDHDRQHEEVTPGLSRDVFLKFLPSFSCLCLTRCLTFLCPVIEKCDYKYGRRNLTLAVVALGHTKPFVNCWRA